MEEKILTINLYASWKKTRYWKRAKRCIATIRKKIAKNFRTDEKNVAIDPWLNMEIWKNSISNPPRKIKVKASRQDKKIVVELFETPKKKLKREKKKILKEAEREKKKEEKKEEEKSEKKEKVEKEVKEEEKAS